MDDRDAVRAVLGFRQRGGKPVVTWFGTRVVDLHADSAPQDLAEVIYTWAYSVGRPTPITDLPPLREDPRWRRVSTDARLSASWSGWSRTAEGTFSLEGLPNIAVAAHRVTLAEDGRFTVALPPLTRGAIPGWLLARHGDVAQTTQHVRIYINTDPERLVETLPALFDVLLARGSPFSAKFLVTSAHCSRADSTVIYLPQLPRLRGRAAIANAIAPAIAATATPMFTRRVTAGVGWAIGPTDGSSYGMSESLTLAHEVIDVYRKTCTTRQARFSRNTHRPDTSVSAGDTAAAHHRETGARPEHGTPAGKPLSPIEDLLRTTDQLRRTALDHDHRATWLTPTRDGRTTTLGARAYDGLSGPLLLLAHATALSNDQADRQLVVSTSRTMLDRQHELPAHGFHAGRAGTAAVLAEAATITCSDELRAHADEALERALHALTPTREWDLISGIAGTIIALHAASVLLGRDLTDELRELGHQLRDMHEEDPDSRHTRWRFRSGRNSATLASLAHGGTGAALALVIASGEVSDETTIAQRSIRFEDDKRSDERGWLDFRNPGRLEPATAWCHGSAGIGLGTVALRDHTGGATPLHQPTQEQLAERVTRAHDLTLAALHRSVDSQLQTGARDPTNRAATEPGLCHGISGQVVAAYVMARHLGLPVNTVALDQFLSGVRPAPSDDLRLSHGIPGILLARLALVGIAPPPLSHVLLPPALGDVGVIRGKD